MIDGYHSDNDIFILIGVYEFNSNVITKDKGTFRDIENVKLGECVTIENIDGKRWVYECQTETMAEEIAFWFLGGPRPDLDIEKVITRYYRVVEK